MSETHKYPAAPETANCEAPAWVAEFYAELIVTGSVRNGVQAVGVPFEDVWRLRRESPDFAFYWDKSIELYRSGALVALVAGPRGALQ
jgi:hypothetical protein